MLRLFKHFQFLDPRGDQKKRPVSERWPGLHTSYVHFAQDTTLQYILVYDQPSKEQEVRVFARPVPEKLLTPPPRPPIDKVINYLFKARPPKMAPFLQEVDHQ
jgi:hypothetical protein